MEYRSSSPEEVPGELIGWGRLRFVPDQKIQVHLKVPMHPVILRGLLEDEGFEVEEVVEVRGGVFNAVDIASFVVEHLDEAVIGVLASVVANLISRAPLRRSMGDRAIGFSVTDSEKSVIVNVTGDGNWIQVHPRPEQPGEEE